MKKILRLRIEGISPYKEVDLSFDKKGLVRLQGPNGAGKSTPFNLMTNMLAGGSPNKRDKANLVPDKKAVYLLEVTWTFNHKTYVAAYAQNSEKLNPLGEAYDTGTFLYENGVDISDHKQPATVKKIQQYFGTTLEEWYSKAYTAQASSHFLINGTEAERMNYLSGLFGLENMQSLSVMYKGKADALKDKMEELEGHKKALEINNSLLTQHPSLEEIRLKILNNESRTKEYDAQLKSLKEKQLDYDTKIELEKQLLQFTPEVVGASEALLREIIISSGKLKESLKVYEGMYISLHQQLTNLPVIQKIEYPEGAEKFLASPDLDLTAVTAAKLYLEGVRNSLVPVMEPVIPSDYEEVLASPDINLRTTQDMIAAIKKRPQAPEVPKVTSEELMVLQGDILKFNQDIQNTRHKLKHLGYGKDTCETCGSELSVTDREKQKAQQELILSLRTKDLEEVDAQYRTKLSHFQAWNEYMGLGPDLSDQLPGLEASVALYGKKQTYLEIAKQKVLWEKYNKDLEAIKEIPELEQRIYTYQMKKYVMEVEKSNQQYEANEKVRQGLNEQLQRIPPILQLQKEIKEHSDQVETSTELLRKKEEYLKVLGVLNLVQNAINYAPDIAKLEELKQELNREIGFVTSEKKTVEGIHAEIQSLTQKILDLSKDQRDFARYTALAKAYGKEGILRKLQLSRFNKYLSNALLPYTMRLLPHMRFVFNIEEGVEFNAVKEGVEPYDVKTCSGGEKGCLTLALMFALDDMSPSFKKFNLKIIDEIEAFMDKDRKEEFLHFVVPELRKRAETIVMISHTPSAGDIEYDEVWAVGEGTIRSVGEIRGEHGIDG